jgi:transposase
VAIEATGDYEQQAFRQLSEQGLPVAILNPRAVRQFAERSVLQRSRRICGCFGTFPLKLKPRRDHNPTRRARLGQTHSYKEAML